MKSIASAIALLVPFTLVGTSVGLAARPESVPAYHVPLGINLIQNPGAERGVGSPTWNDQEWVPDWQVGPGSGFAAPCRLHGCIRPDVQRDHGTLTVGTYDN